MGKSIVDVAKLAGLSISTVARVANDSPLVSQQTAERVKRAMQELGYEPAPPLRRRGPKTEVNRGIRTRNIALLLVGMDEVLVSRLTGPGPVANSLSDHGLNLIYVPMRDPAVLPSIISRKQIDGAIIQGIEPVGKAAEALKEIPLVWMLTRRSDTFWADSIEPDNRAIGEMAANYLIQRGHTLVAHANIQPNYPAFRVRGQAFQSYARGSGAAVTGLAVTAVNPSPLFQVVPDQAVVDEHMRQILESDPRPSGLFVSTQVPYVYSALRKLGVEPGKDIEIIAGDNVPVEFPWIRPMPAAVDPGIQNIAQRAVDQLIWRIRHPRDAGPVRLAVAPKLLLPGA